MKKQNLILMALIATFSFSALAFVSSQESEPKTDVPPSCKKVEENTTAERFQRVNALDTYLDVSNNFHYEIGTRFINHVSKEKLHSAKTIWDILPSDGPKRQVNPYTDIQIHIVKAGDNIIEKGKSENLNEAQLALIKKMDYSTNLAVLANYDPSMNPRHDQYISYYMTVTPSKQAEYKLGNDALILYLQRESFETVSKLNMSDLKPGKISFLVSKEGKIELISLEDSCGDKATDMKMLSIINNLPENWNPAKDEQGNSIEQKLYFSFGIVGC